MQTLGTNASDPPPSVIVLRLHVSARDVVKLDVGSPSDPMCVFFIFQNHEWVEWGRTEVIWNNPNPSWVAFFDIAYVFEMEQRVRFMLYSCSSGQADLSKHAFVGQVDTDIQAIIATRGRDTSFDVRHPDHTSKRAVLHIDVEQAQTSSSFVFGCLASASLKKLHTFSKNSPFVQIDKLGEGGRKVPVYRSEVLPKVYGGMWKPFEVQTFALCNDNHDLPLTISIYDYNPKKPPMLVGSLTASLATFLSSVTKPLALEPPTPDPRPVGTVKFVELSVMRKPTFYDYVRGGLELNLVTAIDFTGSNGPPSSPSSLHYIYGETMNPYEACISAVGRIVCPYDVDQLFPVYGFGAQVGDEVSHCFPLTFDVDCPSVRGLEGILSVYKHALCQIQLSGPTLFAPVVQAATQNAVEAFEGGKTYTILLILTDGCISDQRETTEAIVAASDTPLSIIIVGIGTADFSAMVYLDGDEEPLKTSKGERCKRDIVQFVPFSKYRGQPAQLAMEVLAEVPRQVYEFCSQKRIKPRA
jgi:hypothetical protein